MKKILSFAFLFFSQFAISQTEGVVIHRETKEPIPYVNIWVEGEERGTTANLNGKYSLDTDGGEILIFSAVGFETLRAATDTLTKTVTLLPSRINLDEVVISPSNILLKKVVGSFKKSKVKYWRKTGKIPHTAARFFEYKEEYAETPFLKKLRIVTKSHVKNAKFNIRLYRANKTGAPGEYLYNRNIYGYAKKLKQYTEIDLSDLNIVFPKEGLFVAVEWLIIEENEHRYIADHIDQHNVRTRNKEMVDIQPKVGSLPANSQEFAWIIIRGEWFNLAGNIFRSDDSYEHLHRAPAIELTLSNQ